MEMGLGMDRRNLEAILERTVQRTLNQLTIPVTPEASQELRRFMNRAALRTYDRFGHDLGLNEIRRVDGQVEKFMTGLVQFSVTRGASELDVQLLREHVRRVCPLWPIC